MERAMIDLVGWAATTVFCASYFFKKPGALRRMQMMGAALWLLYGILLGAPPVIVANILVMLAAGFTAVRAARSKQAS
jgi:Bacterial inner membrane protein